jgi:hypothetical protein
MLPSINDGICFSKLIERVGSIICYQEVSKRCRLSWLTNSALVYEPKCGVGGGKLQGLGQ